MNALRNETVDDTCIWNVQFETNTGKEATSGELPLLTVAFYDINNLTYGDLSTSVVEVCFLC